MVKNTLTRAEEQLMQYLWEIENGFLKDILEKFPEPRPAYTTVSTVIRVLVKKGFIGFRTYGKINEYFPKISKTAYFQDRVRPMLSNYLEDSPTSIASYFTNSKLNVSELEEIKKLIEEKIKKLKTKRK